MDERRNRIQWILQRIYDDIINDSIPKTDFVDYYLNLSESQRHETHTFISLSLEFRRGGRWNEEGVVDNDFLEWLEYEDPTIYLGEMNGKHSDVVEEFSTILDKTDTDYYKVEANKHKLASCLDDIYDDWIQARSLSEEFEEFEEAKDKM